MLARLIAGAGLFVIGYYLGKEIGRTEPIREELRRARERNSSPEPSTDAAATNDGRPGPED